MAEWNRFDICEAYYVIEVDYNEGGWLRERPSNVRRGQLAGRIGEATHVQLHRMHFKPRHDLNYEKLSDNGKLIYRALMVRYGLMDEAIDNMLHTAINTIYGDVEEMLKLTGSGLDIHEALSETVTDADTYRTHGEDEAAADEFAEWSCADMLKRAHEVAKQSPEYKSRREAMRQSRR